MSSDVLGGSSMWARRPAAQRRRVIAAGLAIALAVGGFIAYALVVRGSGSPAAGSGKILHERIVVRHVPYAGAGHSVTATEERWVQEGPRSRFRAVSGWLPGKQVEVGGDANNVSAYDPTTRVIYDGVSGVMTGGFADPNDAYRTAVAVTGKTVVGRTTLRGIPVVKIRIAGAAFGGLTFYIDPKTNLVLRMEGPGLPLRQRGGPGTACGFRGLPSTTVVDVTTYDYLPPTGKNLKQLSLQAQHPQAPVRQRMSPHLKKVLTPPCGRVPPALP